MLGGRDQKQFDQVWRQKAENDKVPRQYQPGNERIDKALRIIPPGDRFLDIGCGTGVLSASLANRYNEVHGIDIAEMPVQIACESGVKAQVHNLNTAPLPYEDQYFDMVTGLSVIQYFYDLKFAFDEISRVLKPSGRLVLSVPNMRAFWRIVKLAWIGSFPRTSLDTIGYDGGALHYFCFRDVEQLLNDHRFYITAFYGIFCMPGFTRGLPDKGLIGGLKREFLSAEILLMAQKG